MRKTEYWTLFKYANVWSFCSTHKTEKAARAAADKCEAQGRGAKHAIAKVEYLPRKVKP